jgi:hypothetical protein
VSGQGGRLGAQARDRGFQAVGSTTPMSTKRTRGGGGAAAAAGRRPRNSPKWYEDDWPGPSGKVRRSQDDFEADGFESDGFEVEMDADE